MIHAWVFATVLAADPVLSGGAFAGMNPGDSRPYHLDPNERAAIDAAIQRGSSWLLARQGKDGTFLPGSQESPCPLPLTAMALWALAEAAPSEVCMDQAISAALETLLRHRQPAGGIYDPACGLSVYSSGVASQALRACLGRQETPGARNALVEVEAFLARRSSPESMVDARAAPLTSLDALAVARTLEDQRVGLSSAQQAATKFLSRTLRSSGKGVASGRGREGSRVGARAHAFAYEDVLPLVFEPLRPNEPRLQKARDAIERYYTLDRNPDLTKRYGPLGFFPGTQGLYYYYLVLARTLGAFESPIVPTPRGPRTDWVRELTEKLLSLQEPQGLWQNKDPRWWESEPVLVTSYALLALRISRDTRGMKPTESKVSSVDSALARGRSWIQARQLPDGSFAAGPEAGPVLPTALALWALASSRTPVGEAELLRASAALFAHRRADGGLYEHAGPRGLLESEAARHALAAVDARVESDQVKSFLRELEQFLAAERKKELERFASQKPEPPLPDVTGLRGPEAHAVEFLRRLREGAASRQGVLSPGTRTARLREAEDVVPLRVFSSLSARNAAVVAARDAIRASWPLDASKGRVVEPFGDAKLLPEDASNTFKYFVATRVLGALGDPVLELADGSRIQWREAITDRLTRLQSSDGSWSTGSGSATTPRIAPPGDALLETSYALITLNALEALSLPP